MLTLEQIKDRLNDRRIDIVARRTGLHYNTIKGLRDGTNGNPKHSTISRISQYLSVCDKFCHNMK